MDGITRRDVVRLACAAGLTAVAGRSSAERPPDGGASPPASWLEVVWTEREERFYPALFGPLRGIFPIPGATFAKLGASADPRWLTIGVFEAGPTVARRSWAYLTSGLSNPWEGEADPNGPSGYGCELLLETTHQAEWPIRILHHLAAIQLLATSGRIPGGPLGLEDRVALHGPIDGTASVLRAVLVTEPVSCPPVLQQRSGVAQWLFCVGISDEEKSFGREHGSAELQQRLVAAGAFPVTDPARPSLSFAAPAPKP